jgi:hypothetical protein
MREGTHLLAMPGVQAAQASAARQATTVVPRIGIGGVRLEEPRSAVERALGRGKRIAKGPRAGEYRYRSSALGVVVDYNSEGLVDSVSTTSREARLYGHRLGEGLHALRRVLRAHGWRVYACDSRVFTLLLPGGPGTGIAWRNGVLDEVVIDGGGSWGQQCEH